MFTYHYCNGGLFDHEIVNVYNSHILWNDCWVNDILRSQKLHTHLHGIYSETSNPKEDYISYNQKYIDHVLHVMMIKVGKLRTKIKLSNAFLLHSFIVKSN